MWDNLKVAAQQGAVEGVKWAIATAIVLMAVSWLLGDYMLVRRQAQSGQAAFTYIQQLQQAQQAQRDNQESAPK